MVELETSIWQRAAPREIVCGDSYLVSKNNHILTVAVIDGLGHGPEAHKAASIAAEVLQSRQSSLVQIIPEIHWQLMGTRGVVLGIICIDMESGRIKYIGIGNINTYVIYQNRVKMLLPTEGFLGCQLPAFREIDLVLEEVEQLIMASDGIATIPRRDLLKIAWQKADDMAQTIGEKWGLHRDDETVLIVKKKGY